MTLPNKLLAAAAALMVVTGSPAAALPENPAAALSVVKPMRASGSVGRANRLGASGGGLLAAVGIGVAVLVAILIAGSMGSDSPDSA